MSKGDVATTQTLEKSLLILEYLVEVKTSSLTKLAKQLGMHKSTAYRHLATYKKLGYISQDENDGYYLTDKLMKMASGVVPQMEIRELTLPYLVKLATLTSSNTNIGFWNGKEILYLAQKRPYPISPFVVGETIPAYCSALGKAILAYLPEKELAEYTKTEFIKFTKKTIISKDLFYEEIEKIKNNGYALMDEEILLGLYGVAVPIFTGEKVPKYAISVASSLVENIEELLENSLDELQKTAKQISKEIMRR